MLLSIIGFEIKSLDGLRKVSKGETEKFLTRVTDRRNKIAHEADRLGRGRTTLTTEETTADLDGLESVVQAIATLTVISSSSRSLDRIFPHLRFVPEGSTEPARELSRPQRRMFELPRPLAQSLSTPLLLGCVRDANLTEAQLNDLALEVRDSGEAAEERLLDHYLRASIESMERRNPQFRKGATASGHRSVAGFLEREGSSDLSYWTFFQSARIAGSSIRSAMSLILGVLVGLICAVVSTVGHGFGAGVGAGLIGSTIAHLVVRQISEEKARRESTLAGSAD